MVIKSKFKIRQEERTFISHPSLPVTGHWILPGRQHVWMSAPLCWGTFRKGNHCAKASTFKESHYLHKNSKTVYYDHLWNSLLCMVLGLGWTDIHTHTQQCVRDIEGENGTTAISTVEFCVGARWFWGAHTLSLILWQTELIQGSTWGMQLVHLCRSLSASLNPQPGICSHMLTGTNSSNRSNTSSWLEVMWDGWRWLSTDYAFQFVLMGSSLSLFSPISHQLSFLAACPTDLKTKCGGKILT